MVTCYPVVPFGDKKRTDDTQSIEVPELNGISIHSSVVGDVRLLLIQKGEDSESLRQLPFREAASPEDMLPSLVEHILRHSNEAVLEEFLHSNVVFDDNMNKPSPLIIEVNDTTAMTHDQFYSIYLTPKETPIETDE